MKLTLFDMEALCAELLNTSMRTYMLGPHHSVNTKELPALNQLFVLVAYERQCSSVQEPARLMSSHPGNMMLNSF
jgi:hypothetical protein